MTTTTETAEWHATACILCHINCGIEVKLDGPRFARIRGDKANPGSTGYTCEKALRLDHYQNSEGRLTSPLRRRPDGSYEKIDWDTAITEVADRLSTIRDTHGGESIFYYGGGGQGNHLGGMYATATRAALGVEYSSNALAQEKTGEFWVDSRLYGRTDQHTAPDLDAAEVVVIIGKNPWHSHGFKRARAVLKEISKDPSRTLVVMDPRRTETADLADVHLAVRPGGDAWALAALLAVLVQEDLVDHAFLDAHTTGSREVMDLFGGLAVADYSARAGIDETMLRSLGRRIAAARSVSILEDLGVQQAPHSTLNSWLEKLIYLLTGNFAKRGSMNLHSWMERLWGGPGDGGSTPVGGAKIIAKLVPGNAIADEILTDHPDRLRAMIVESANPAHSLADSARVREALGSLECLVVIDVALTETARIADYVLPAASQYEKWETTLFNFEFPENYFHVRAPLLDPWPGTLPEPEIHRRLVRALGAITDDDLAPLHAAAAEGRAAYAEAFLDTLSNPRLAELAPLLLLETLGPTLGAGRAGTAVLWGVAHRVAMAYGDSLRRAGFGGDGLELGESLFSEMVNSPSGITFTVDAPAESWRRVRTRDGRVHLLIPELASELATLATESPTPDGYPFVLTAGERRTSTANTIMRDPAWRKKDRDGALRLNSHDAAASGLCSGDQARVTTKRGSAVAVVEVTDTMRRGHASLPNGLGLDHPDDLGATVTTGVSLNELTATEDCDPIAGTPWHKHVPARIERV